MPAFRGGKMAGVINNGDGGTNEMSYVDMHDLHPENVQAAQVHGAARGAMEGATFAAIPAALVSLGSDVIKENGIEHTHFNLKNWKIGAAIIGIGAVIMGVVRAYTAKKDAETHNTWSDRVLKRMEESEARQQATAVENKKAAQDAMPNR